MPNLDRATVSTPITGYTVGTKAAGLVEVLVDCPGTQALYTYNVPDRLSVGVGDILSVPLGGQVVGGIAIRFVDRLPDSLAISQVKDIEDVVASGLFKPNYWQWLSQIAEYYYTPLIQVIKVALPPGLLTRSHRRIRAISIDVTPDIFLSEIAKQILKLLNSTPTRNYSWQHIQKQIPQARKGLRELIDRQLVESYLESGQTPQPKLQKAVILTADIIGSDLSDRQRQIVGTLKQHDGELWQSELVKLSGTTPATLTKIAEKGYIAIVNKEKLRSERELGIFQQEPAKLLTPDQAAALTVINRISGFAQVLLHGVTGSGKTEVYLQAIEQILAKSQSVLVLVPEIGLTPQLTDRFRSRFGDKVCVYHSALSDGERYDTWRQMFNHTSQIIIGTRSAIFAPVPNLGLIILDEEHDSSFKQDQPAPTYQTRDIAKWRAELEACPLILGSAPPSLETWVNIHPSSTQHPTPNTQLPTPNSQLPTLTTSPSPPASTPAPSRPSRSSICARNCIRATVASSVVPSPKPCARCKPNSNRGSCLSIGADIAPLSPVGVAAMCASVPIAMCHWFTTNPIQQSRRNYAATTATITSPSPASVQSVTRLISSFLAVAPKKLLKNSIGSFRNCAVCGLIAILPVLKAHIAGS